MEQQILKEIKDLKRELFFSSFDTVYTSFLIFIMGVIIAIILGKGLFNLPILWQSVFIFSMVMLSLSLLLQFLSIFSEKKTLKRWSLLVVIISLLAIFIFFIKSFIKADGWPYYLLLFISYLGILIVIVAINIFFEKKN